MSITKVVTYGLTVRDVLGVYTNPDVNILNILRDKFVGRCAFGCMITSVNSLIKREECIMIQDGECGSGNIDVTFEITGSYYRPDEIVNGCKIVKIDNKSGTIACVSRDSKAAVLLKRHDKLESLKVGQIISIRATRSQYVLGSNMISVNARPFFATKNKVYKLKPFDKRAISVALKTMKEEELRAAEIKEKASEYWDVFGYDLLYSYSSPQSVPKDSIMSFSDLMMISRTWYVSRDARLDLRNPNVVVWKDLDDIPDDLVVDETIPPVAVMSTLIYDYCDFIRTIREMIEIYNTPALVNEHANLWMIYKKTKLSK